VPDEIDQQVAEMKLAALDVRIDSLTPEQSAYLGL
jgi:S-adenosylhomocysteine hydrolase